MEQQPTNQTREEERAAIGWEAWEAAPRDGPAVFVIDAPRLDKHSEVRGAWIDPTTGSATFGLEVAKLLGRAPSPDEWAIVDQIGLGERMLPENFELPELNQVIAELLAAHPPSSGSVTTPSEVSQPGGRQ